jgi:undecaprenyl-diphosphatase
MINAIDADLFQDINGLAGKNSFCDEMLKGLAGDYFLPVGICLFLAFLWFATGDRIMRRQNQQAILISLAGIGIANGLVALSNHLYFRIRPFNEPSLGPVNLLFYRPTDSSFPSNFATVLFAIGTAVFTKNRKIGIVLLSVALLGGFARIYVGVHYPLDVLGGAVIGATSSLAAYQISRFAGPWIDSLFNLLQKIYLA